MSSRFQLEIRLPEGVTFALPLAGPVSRCLAFLIDLFVVSALTTAFQRAAVPLRIVEEDLAVALVMVFYLAAWLLYGILCEYYWYGQTFGKWLLGLRVADSSGLELQLYQVTIRNLIRALDLFPVLGLAGGITMLSNRRLQRLGDLAAGTVVVSIRQPPMPNIEALAKGRFNSFRAHPLLCARLRQRALPETVAIAVEALMRRDGLDDRARLAVFDELATHFEALVRFPPEETEQLSSEQYVRNVVEILCSPPRTPAARMQIEPVTVR